MMSRFGNNFKCLILPTLSPLTEDDYPNLKTKISMSEQIDFQNTKHTKMCATTVDADVSAKEERLDMFEWLARQRLEDVHKKRDATIQEYIMREPLKPEIVNPKPTTSEENQNNTSQEYLRKTQIVQQMKHKWELLSKLSHAVPPISKSEFLPHTNSSVSNTMVNHIPRRPCQGIRTRGIKHPAYNDDPVYLNNTNDSINGTNYPEIPAFNQESKGIHNILDQENDNDVWLPSHLNETISAQSTVKVNENRSKESNILIHAYAKHSDECTCKCQSHGYLNLQILNSDKEVQVNEKMLEIKLPVYHEDTETQTTELFIQNVSFSSHPNKEQESSNAEEPKKINDALPNDLHSQSDPKIPIQPSNAHEEKSLCHHNKQRSTRTSLSPVSVHGLLPVQHPLLTTCRNKVPQKNCHKLSDMDHSKVISYQNINENEFKKTLDTIKVEEIYNHSDMEFKLSSEDSKDDDNSVWSSITASSSIALGICGHFDTPRRAIATAATFSLTSTDTNDDLVLQELGADFNETVAEEFDRVNSMAVIQRSKSCVNLTTEQLKSAAKSITLRNVGIQRKKCSQMNPQREFSLCNKCNKIVRSVDSTFQFHHGHQYVWHKTCFTCVTCGIPLGLMDHLFHENEPYCLKHYILVADVPQCHGCGGYIFDSIYTSACGYFWHKDHFTCYKCRNPLIDTKFVVMNGLSYCFKCHRIDFVRTCELCKSRILSDEAHVESGGYYWHSTNDCCICSKCNQNLVGRSVFFRKAGFLYCNRYCGALGRL